MKIRSATLEYQGQVFTFTSKPVFGATGAWVLEDVTGWYGGVGVRAETTDRLGHGMFQQRAWRSNRALTLAATYIANDPDERLALQRALSGMLWAGDYGTLTVETDRVLSCPVRLDGEPGIVELGTHGVQLQVPLVSMDPWLYGEDRVTYLYPQGTGVGLEYPLFTRIPSGRFNVVPNHAFATDLTGWTGFRADITRVASGDGWAARITSTTDTQSSSLLETVLGTTAHPVTPGQHVTVSYDLTESEGASVDSLLYFYDSSGALLSTLPVGAKVAPGGTTVRPVGSLSAPEGAVTFRALLGRAVRPLGSSADISRVSIEVGETPTSGNYFGAALGTRILSYGSAIDTDDRITNGGNAVAYPTYLVVGDFPGGVTIAVSGGSITFPWPISENAPLRVDTSGSAWIGGTNVTTRLTSRAFSKFAVPPGSTTAPKVTALQGGEGFVEMHISDTFI